MIRDLSYLDIRPLVELAREGDREAFGEIYVRYAPRVYRFIDRKVTSRALAEDLTAETFVRALRKIEGFAWHADKDIGAWLTTIARHLVFDHYKSHRVRRELSGADELLGYDPAEDDPEQSVVERLSTLDLRAVLLAALAELTPEQRRAIVLRHLRGLSVQETGRAMGRADGAVKALTYRATRRLATLLDGQPEPSPPIPPQPYPPWPRPRRSREDVPA